MDYIQLGHRIQEVRNHQNFTQQQMAKELHFSQQHIGNVERGNAHPSVDLLVEICNILDVSVDYLLQDSLRRPYIEKSAGVLTDVQQFLNYQQAEIRKLQKTLQKL
mgnify:FL=1|jgi:transcriptional regulator with XRE-family HTH domain